MWALGDALGAGRLSGNGSRAVRRWGLEGSDTYRDRQAQTDRDTDRDKDGDRDGGRDRDREREGDSERVRACERERGQR